MKKLIIIIAGFIALMACSEIELDSYSGTDNVQFPKSSIEYFWASALNPNLDYDTCWVPVQAMGRATAYDRTIKLEQVEAKGYDLVYDHIGNVVDTTYYVLPYQAKEGVHYVPFNDAGLEKFMKLPSGQFYVEVPVVMHKDPDTNRSILLQIRLVDTETTLAGQARDCKITIQ